MTVKKLYRHPTKGHIEEVTFLEDGPTARAFYEQGGFVEIPFPAQMPPQEDRAFWEAPDGTLVVNVSAKAAHAARDTRTMAEKLADILLARGVVTTAEATQVKDRSGR